MGERCIRRQSHQQNGQQAVIDIVPWQAQASQGIGNLQTLQRKLYKEHKCIDFTVLHVSIADETECAFLRLPNQSKDGVNKPAPPMRILQGELCDFLVTDIEGLVNKTDLENLK